MSSLEVILHAQPATLPAELPTRPHRRHDYTGWMQAHPALSGPEQAAHELVELFGPGAFTAAPAPAGPPQSVPEGMYMIGDLARALGRKPRTIHTWIDRGIIPEAPRRTKGPTYPGPLGKPVSNSKRLWPAAEINAIVEIAKEEGLLPSSTRPLASTNFKIRVQDAIRELRG